MPPGNSSSSALPAGQTGNACVQCRHRKQKCGGITYGIKCHLCTTRKVDSSFQKEVKDLRYIPYLPKAQIFTISSASTPYGTSDVQPPSPSVLSQGRDAARLGQGLPGETDSLRARIAYLETELTTSIGENRGYVQFPQVHVRPPWCSILNWNRPETQHPVKLTVAFDFRLFYVMRVTLRSSHDDQKLKSIQALMLCAHWMPFQPATSPERFRSRFSEGRCLEVLRASYSLGRGSGVGAELPYEFPASGDSDARERVTVPENAISARNLTLSARQPSYLDPKLFLGSLFRVAYGAHFTGCRPTTVESVEAFDKDAQLIERQSILRLGNATVDGLSQHFPFTSLRRYRLSYACAFLDAAGPAQRDGKALAWAIEWASQILYHLSIPSSPNRTDNIAPGV
ncbi:hypothetical protein BJX76DRAFT_362143 [Aspergillus varians]